MIYEATIRVHAPGGLSDADLRTWGDTMADAEDNVAGIFGTTAKVEAHGPERLAGPPTGAVPRRVAVAIPSGMPPTDKAGYGTI